MQVMTDEQCTRFMQLLQRRTKLASYAGIMHATAIPSLADINVMPRPNVVRGI